MEERGVEKEVEGRSSGREEDLLCREFGSMICSEVVTRLHSTICPMLPSDLANFNGRHTTSFYSEKIGSDAASIIFIP